MNLFSKHKLAVLTSVYWIMLLYMLTALLWWFIALNNQNKIMAELRMLDLQKDDAHYAMKAKAISAEKDRKTAQCIDINWGGVCLQSNKTTIKIIASTAKFHDGGNT